MGAATTMVEVGKMEFFFDQAPVGMKSLGSSFSTTSVGLGNFLSSFLLSTVEKITGKGGMNGWIENNLDESHLDCYYGFLAVFSILNLIMFLVVSKFFVYNLEMLAYFGIAPNLVIYLTQELHQGTISSSNNVTNWTGTILMIPILAAYLADTYLGRYWTFLFSSLIYLLGMILLTLSVSLHSLRPSPCNSLYTEDCSGTTKHIQVVIFFLSLYIVALGIGGTKATLITMGAEQFDISKDSERSQTPSFFNWWSISIFCGNLFSCIVLVYIQDNVGWSVGYAIPTIVLGIAIIIFIVGTPFYRHKPPSGSALTSMIRILVEASRKWWLQVSCPSKQVQEAKQLLKLLPIFFVTIVPSIMLAQVITLFVKQGTTLDRSIGPAFSVPTASLTSFFSFSSLISLVFYDRYVVKWMRKLTKNPRGISTLQRIAIGQGLHVITMIVAASIESWRLAKVGPLSFVVLCPQFVLMGAATTMVEVGKMEFFFDQAPVGMKSLGSSFSTTSVGLGNFLSSFLLSTVEKITGKGGMNGWIENNLDESHLDYYYGFLAVLSILNLIMFLAVSKFFVYNNSDVVHQLETIFVESNVQIVPEAEISEKS
ncbi:Peptide transporter PTR3-A [Platanthera zijinensis]|uniref:Peptide transporter PTR3-A n=1 Tax=Platanthera zijinensis TaxID=2320716 RepID=A0AAP0BQJ3_9ASPA